ncbi:MAG TPA: S1/P1 nuclease [Bryobacteraceae bacterium]|nr:S1/P1 nuclease [Bryobacteraceae bacterium]
MSKLQPFTMAVVSLFGAQAIHAWGVTGHHVVALIAEQRITPEVRERIERLLFNGKYTMRDISACADEIRSNRGRTPGGMCVEVAGNITQNTGPWHYIDIPPGAKDKNLDKYCPNGDCVVNALERFTKVLHDSSDDAERRTALLFVVHFMGDIHQPLHCTERACDQGGNRELVNFYLGDEEKADAHLHSVWDTDIVNKLMKDMGASDERALTTALLDRLDPDSVPGWLHAGVPKIAWEGNALAKKKVYRGIPFQDFCPTPTPKPNPAVDLKPGYESEAARVARTQLTKAGVRLADLLDRNVTR